MKRLRFGSAGESHGPAEVCILEGLPAGLRVDPADIDKDLARRQRGYGRGGRMTIETDRVRILAGIRLGKTLGTPVCLMVENLDHESWRPTMQPEPRPGWTPDAVTVPRPGHADLAGMAKFGHTDARDVLERASARETVSRVAAGALARVLLRAVGVEVHGFVRSIGDAKTTVGYAGLSPAEIDWEAVEASECGCPDPRVEAAMKDAVDAARRRGESLGGVFEIWAWGLCPGLGGYGSPGDRLDGRLMGALGSIPAIKGVESGMGFAAAVLPGSAVHDALFPPQAQGEPIERRSNGAGGLEGGITNGLPLIVRAAMKPIPTLMAPLASVDLRDGSATSAHRERSDVEAVAAARVVGEAMVALELADAYLEKFGGDSVEDLCAGVSRYEERLRERGLWRRS
ncbi:MAG: chorismate synthase [Thermoleophilia bacterium]